MSKAGFESSTVREVITAIITCENHFDRHIWFVYALFIIFILVILFYSFFSKAASLLAIIVFYTLITKLFAPVEIVDRVLYNLFYFCLGMQTIWIENWLESDKTKVFIIFIIFSVSACFCLTWCNLESNSYLIKIFDICFSTAIRYTAAVTGSLLIIRLSQFIIKYIRLNNFLGFLSYYSYDIYLIHNPIIVNGVSYSLLVAGAPMIAAILISVVIGLVVSIVASKYIFRKVRVLSVCFLGRNF